MSEWVYVTGGAEGTDVKLDGLHVWKYEWTPVPRDAVSVRDPRYGREFRFDVYTITDGRRIILFAAGEFANAWWGFFQPRLEEG